MSESQSFASRRRVQTKGNKICLKRVNAFKRVILITGTPGVGKTSVSTLLASRLDAIHIDLSGLVKREKLTSGMDKARGTLIADSEKVSGRLQKILRDSKRDVIVDGHYAVDVVPAQDIDLVFVLRRDPEELKEAMEERGFSGRKLWENLAAEVLDVCLWDVVRNCSAEKVCEIDVTGKIVREVVEEIVLVLEGKRKCEVGIVDWLEKLERKGRLHDFLRDF